MFQVFTKPAEMAKQQKSKRCQDLVPCVENFMEDEPKVGDELSLDLQDPNNSYYVGMVIILLALEGWLGPIP